MIKRSKFAEFTLENDDCLGHKSYEVKIMFADIPRGVIFTNVLAKNNLGAAIKQTYTVEIFNKCTRTFGTLEGAKRFISKTLAKMFFVSY